jgi:hypothetical protein
MDKEAVKDQQPRRDKMDGKDKEDSVSASQTSKIEESDVQSASNIDQSEDVVDKKEGGKDDEEKKKKDNKKEYNEPLADELIKPLKIMHRIINQNFYSKEQIIFKN